MFVTGALLGLSAPGYGVWWYAWVGLVPAFWWVSQQAGYQRTALGCFLFGWAYHLVYLAWFPALHPMTWIGFTEWQSVIIVTLGYLLLTGLGGVLIGGLLMIPALGFRYSKIIGSAFLFLFPWLWTWAFDHFSIIQLWIPWSRLVYTQGFSGMAGEETIVFANIATFIFCLISKRIGTVKVGLVWLLLGWFFYLNVTGKNLSYKILSLQWALAARQYVVLQGNLPIDVVRSQQDSWAAAKEVYLDNIKQLDLKPGTLLVLPEEGAIPGGVNIEEPDENPYFSELISIANDKQISIITGITAYKILPHDAREIYNAQALITPEEDVIPSEARNLPRTANVQFYFKRDLVPFGERVPFVDKNWLADQLERFNVGFNPPYKPGPKNPKPMMILMTTDKGQTHTIGNLICFELIKPALSANYNLENKPALLVNTSNLGWFHGNRFGTRLMQEQFLAIGQMRAAENRAFVIISANTGISAIIDPMGNVVARSDRDGKPLPGGATLLQAGLRVGE